MNCSEFLLMIDSRIDDRSSTDEGFDLHLNSCKSCRETWNEQVQLKDRLQKLVFKIKPPAKFQEQILLAVEEKRTPNVPGDICAGTATLAGSVTHQLLCEDIVEIMSSLSPRQRDVLRLRFGLEDGKNRTLEEVGQMLGVSAARIRQIESQALRMLRHPSRARRPRFERPIE